MQNCIIIEKFKNKNDILNELFCAREDELANLEKQVKDELLKENIDINKSYEELLGILNQTYPLDILNKNNLYFEIKNYADALEIEKYYKEGVKDGINIILSCIK